MRVPTPVERRRMLLWTRDALAFLAAALAWVALDADRAEWSLWWPMPLAMASWLLTLWRPGGARPEARVWRGPWLAVALVAAYAAVGLRGPLPHEAWRELTQWAAILSVAVAFWALALEDARRAAWLWAGACGVGFGALGLAGEGMRGASETFAWIGATAWAGVGGWMFVRARWGGCDRWRASRALVWLAPVLVLIAFVLGIVGAGVVFGEEGFQGTIGETLGDRLAHATAREVQWQLWRQSVLLGWGRLTAGRWVEALGAPRACVVAPWGGPLGLAAQYGLAGFVVLILAVVALVTRVARGGARGAAAGVVAAAMAGLFLAGGPWTGAACLSLTVALGLAWGPCASDEGDVDPTRRGWGGLCATGFFTLTALVVALWIARPLTALDELARARRLRADPAVAQHELMSAARRRPTDPAIPLAMASAARNAMNRLPEWNEAHYRRVVRLYEQAMRMDPCSPHAPLTLARFRLICGRDDAALAGMREALERRPNERVLVDWLFLASWRRRRMTQAYAALEWGMRLEAERPIGWRRRYAVADAAGQGPLADHALAVALTADPDDPALLAAAALAHRGRAERPRVRILP